MRRRDFCELIFIKGVGLVILNACKSPVEPDEPDVLRYVKARVTYTRNVAKIKCFKCQAVDLPYRLYDPEAEKNQLNDGVEYVEGGYRIGVVTMEQIGENEFEVYLEKVLVQNQSWHGKHESAVRDWKLYDGFGDFPTQTTENLRIQGAYDIEIKYNVMYYRMSAPGTTRR